MSKAKDDSEIQKASHESQLESLRTSHKTLIETLERKVDDNYNERLRHSYRCIMAVLGGQHPDLKMDELAAGVTEYMNEEATKKGGEEIGPNTIEEATSPSLLALIDVAEASIPPGATGETLPSPLFDNLTEVDLLINPL